LEKPVRFSELLGQDRARAQLRRAAGSGRLPHAYLFCGIEGSGRRGAARMLAARLNCGSPRAEDACGECPSCRKLARGTHPDLVAVEPEAEARRGAGGENDEGSLSRKGLQIKIYQVRALSRRLSFAPVEAKVRVSVVWPAGSLREDAANALLKTLEEPPPGNLLILCCREPNDVLPTIASRCQVVSFVPLPEGLIRDWLLAHGAAEDKAERLAYLAGGSLRRAERLLDAELPEERQRLLEALAALGKQTSSGLLALGASLVRSSHRDELLESLKCYFRDALVLSATPGGADNVINRDLLEPLGRLAARTGPGALTARVGLVERAQAAIEANCDPQLALEVLLFELSRLDEGFDHA
jgi:DNA polymerase-3 subunit delta'